MLRGIEIGAIASEGDFDAQSFTPQQSPAKDGFAGGGPQAIFSPRFAGTYPKQYPPNVNMCLSWGHVLELYGGL